MAMKEIIKLDPVKEQVCNILAQVERGDLNSLYAFRFLHFMEKVSKEAKAKLLDQAINEAQKYPLAQGDIDGSNFKVKSSAGRWDFTEIPQIKELETSLDAEKENAKSSFKQLMKGIRMVNEAGELVTPAKFTPGKETIEITY